MLRSPLADKLSELRKYAVSLTLTTQHFSRIENDTGEAILGNVGTLISFRVSATDAALLTRRFGEDLPQAGDLVGLANHEVFVKVMVGGVQAKPSSARRLPP